MPGKESQSFIRPDEFWQQLGLRANQTVVHLGCGAGFYLIPAAKIVGRKGKVIGIDVRTDMLSEAENKADREGLHDIVITHHYDIEKNHDEVVASGIADWTLVANILYQADPTKILTEAARITNAKGTIVVVEWDIAATPLGPPSDTRVAKREVEKVAAARSLKLIKEFEPSPYHYGLLFKKSGDEASDT